MLCPDCLSVPLQRAFARRGVHVEACPACGGLWLDDAVAGVVDATPLAAMPAVLTPCPPGELPPGRFSPVDGGLMVALIIDDAVVASRCDGSGGTWLGGDAVRALAASGTDFSLVAAAPAPDAAADAAPAGPVRAGASLSRCTRARAMADLWTDARSREDAGGTAAPAPTLHPAAVVLLHLCVAAAAAAPFVVAAWLWLL
jgi:hypothetical protein